MRIEDFELERLAPDIHQLRWPLGTSPVVRRVTAGTSPADLNHHVRIDHSTSTAIVEGLSPAIRQYFLVEFDDGKKLLLAERLIRLRGAHNFRDFGGYSTTSGRHVRWGSLFRSDQLNRLDESDQSLLDQLGIRLVCDFRHDAEREQAPNRLTPNAQLQIEHLSIIPGSAANLFAQIDPTDGDSRAQEMVELMIEINRDLALQQRPIYKKMFELLEKQNGPLLIHCAAGKDRTGFGAALILFALGVSEETLLHDYLLTQRYLPIDTELDRVRTKYQLSLTDEVLRPMLEVRREYLHGALDAAKSEFGSLKDYLYEGLNVDAQMQKHLRARLLQ